MIPTQLDRIAAVFGVIRLPGESSTNLRERLETAKLDHKRKLYARMHHVHEMLTGEHVPIPSDAELLGAHKSEADTEEEI